MARIYPFRALRYDISRVSMEDVVTQPYDKISPAMQQAYYDRSPYNLIRVILGERQPQDTDPYAADAAKEPQHNVYTRAAETLKSWRQEGILKEDAEPSLFGYAQTYTVPGTEEVRERRGLIALGHLYPYSDGVVFRHEQTFPKHKSDRLALFKETRAYCEQIYMLYSDPAFTVDRLVFESNGGQGNGGQARPADLSITDEYGVTHKLWRITDPTTINLLVTALADKKLIIADGHHRYETSVTYMQERAAALGIDPFTRGSAHPDAASMPGGSGEGESDDLFPGESPSRVAEEHHAMLPAPPFPEAAMMMTLVNMDTPGITILPTHRVLFHLNERGRSFSMEEFLRKAEPFFHITPQDSLTDAALTEDERQQKLQAALQTLESTAVTAFVAVTQQSTVLLTAKAEAVRAALPDKSPRQAELDVVQLHALVLEQLLGLSHESIANTENIRYIREAVEAVRQVRESESDLAFLIKPVTMDQLKSISLSGDVMPQKSTDFYPKLLSGLAIYSLD